ncbi:hypothetical protein Tco_0562153 [Tanacetum coccineum]
MSNNTILSPCLISKDQEIQQLQEKARLSKGSSMSGLKALQSHFMYPLDVLKDFGRVPTFKRTFSQDMDLLEKHLTKEILHEIDCKTALTKLITIQMTNKYFVEYTRIKVKHFRDTLLQHMGNVKKLIVKRTRHQRQYDRRVNKRQMQKQESKVDMRKALDAGLFVTKSSGTESGKQNTSSRSRNDAYDDNVDIRPIYD